MTPRTCTYLVATLSAVAFSAAAARPQAVAHQDHAAKPVVQVYKQSTCGCCNKWIQHLKASGFDVRATDVAQLEPIKEKHHVPAVLRTCHTAVVDGYVIEGHVPADLIQKLLRERPEIAGIGVAGMPAGSPGMESPNPVPYEVLSFDKDGRTAVYAKR